MMNFALTQILEMTVELTFLHESNCRSGLFILPTLANSSDFSAAITNALPFPGIQSFSPKARF